MRVAVLSSEAVPFSKTGGLADVAGALPKFLKQLGSDASLITPLYQQTKHETVGKLAIEDLNVELVGAAVTC